MPTSIFAGIAHAAQNAPVLDKLDATDGWSLATIVVVQLLNMWAGDDLFNILVGLGCGALLCLTGVRLCIKAYGEWQDVRMKKIKADHAAQE